MLLFSFFWQVPLIIPILVSFLTAVLVTLSVIEMPRELGVVALVVSLGVPVYFVCVKLQKPKKLFGYMGEFCVCSYEVLLFFYIL